MNKKNISSNTCHGIQQKTVEVGYAIAAFASEKLGSPHALSVDLFWYHITV
jgi:hypothetical protein